MWQKLKNIYHFAVSYLAALYFGFPSKKLTVIGVTGTDGKSTTVNMIYHILKSAGKRASMISSVNAQIGNKKYETGFHVTTPSPWEVQGFLKESVDASSQYFVLETTSHALDQNRAANIDFNVAVITNITHEHLDYHKTLENYAHAKSKLFNNAEYAVLNLDDKSFDFLKNKIKGKIITYSLNEKSDFNLTNSDLKLNIPGGYNLANALAAIAAVSALGIKKSSSKKALSTFPGLRGRMEEVNLGQSFKVVVDFAHTPNALEKALSTLAQQKTDKKSKLIAVFGSAGERDFLKRPLMGKVAAELADISVLTAEDPRTEKSQDIIDQIAGGFKGKKEGKVFFKVPDRKEAIEKAIGLAKPGDIVATFGKAHEKSMCYGKTEYPWDEFETVKAATRKTLKKYAK